MFDSRGGIDVEDLLKLILALVLVWIVLEVLGLVFSAIGALLGPLQPFLGLIVVVLILLWFFDRI